MPSGKMCQQIMKINQLPPWVHPPHCHRLNCRPALVTPSHIMFWAISKVTCMLISQCAQSGPACYDNCHVDGGTSNWATAAFAFIIWNTLPSHSSSTFFCLGLGVKKMEWENTTKRRSRRRQKKMIYEPPRSTNLFTTNCQNGTFWKAHWVGGGGGATDRQ